MREVHALTRAATKEIRLRHSRGRKAVDASAKTHALTGAATPTGFRQTPGDGQSCKRPLQKSSAFKSPVRDVVKVARHFSAGYAFKSELVPEGRLKATSGKRVQASLRDARYLHEFFPALKCRATFNRSYGTN